MARPSAKVINTVEVDEQFSIDVLKSQELWIIMYGSEPASVRYRYWSMKGEYPKYIRTTFPHKRSADNLAKKLNDYFNIDRFTVKKLA